MAKKCPPGKYYCFTDKKCKKIPRGYRIGSRGYLARDNRSDSDGDDGSGNGNGSSNGNGNGGNGSGNGNGGSGGNGGGNGSGGGGVGESVVYETSNVGLIANAVSELEDGLIKLTDTSYVSIDKLMQSISKRNNMSPTLLHNQFKAKHLTIPDDWVIRQKMKDMREGKMTEKEMDKREDIVKGMKKNKSGFKKRYGDDAKSVMYATATKLAMKKEDEFDKYSIEEEGLRAWFGKSSGTTKSGRKVKGWVQVGGKYDGKPCARQPGQKSTPKCTSSSKRSSMSDKERDSAARRKRAADPNQPQKSGAAKPTNVSTDPKKKMKENYFNRNKVVEGFKGYADLSHMETPEQKKAADKRLKKANEKSYREQKKKDTKESFVNEAKDKKGKGSGTKDACYTKVKSRYSVWPSAYASGALVKCRKVGAANWGNSTKKEGFSPMQVSALEAAGMIEIKEGQKCWKGYEKKGTKMMFGKRYNNCVKKKATKEEVELQEMNPLSFIVKQTKTSKLQNMAKTIGPEGKIAKDKLAKIKAKEPKLPMTSDKKVTEGVAFLKREKLKKKSKSEYVGKYDAGKAAKRVMAKKDQEKVNFLPPEETNEEKVRLVKNGHTYKVVLTWRGNTYMVQMFVPSVSRPTRQEVEKQVQKIYPDAKVLSFLPKMFEPGEPTVMVGEGVKRDEYGDPIGGPKISKKQLKKNLASNEKDEKITRSEEYISELSPATLGSYIKKASVDSAIKIGHAYSRSKPSNVIGPDLGNPRTKKIVDKAHKRFEGIKTATDKLTKQIPKKDNKRNTMRGASPDSTQSFSQEEYVDLPLQVEIPLDEARFKLGLMFRESLDTDRGMLFEFESNDKHSFHMKNTLIPLDIAFIKEDGTIDSIKELKPHSSVPVYPDGEIRYAIETNRGWFVENDLRVGDKILVNEDDMKGMSVKSGHKRPTKSGAGMTAKGVAAYRRRNPGSKLKTAVTGKVKKGSKAANRRKSYCARSAGQMKKFPKAAKDPNSRLRQARRRWKC